jgi:hypothetical protein
MIFLYIFVAGELFVRHPFTTMSNCSKALENVRLTPGSQAVAYCATLPEVNRGSMFQKMEVQK